MLAFGNRQAFKKLPGSRESAFAEMDRPALRPLPKPITNLPMDGGDGRYRLPR